MKIGKKESMVAYLEPEQKVALKKLSDKTRVPMQEYLREGVDLILEKYKKHIGKR